MQELLFPKKIITGEKSVESIRKIINQENTKRVYLFVDPIIDEIGLTKGIKEILDEQNVEYKIYLEITPEPTVELANKAVEAVRDYKPDLVIGVGGGSCLDCAKIAATLMENDGVVEDYLNLTATKKLRSTGILKIIIPTTAGTGADVSQGVAFTLPNSKDVIVDEHLVADVAIIDPEFMYTMPPKVTASSGMDAFSHAIESYLSKGGIDLTDFLALEAIGKINRNLRTAVWDGSNKNARAEMAYGTLIGSLSYNNAGVHAVHALGYPLGGKFKVSHGESNSVLLPYVFNYIWTGCLSKIRLLAESLDLSIKDKTNRELAIEISKVLYELVKDVGINTSIKDFGVKEDDLEELVSEAMKQTRLLSRAPRELNQQDILKIYQSAYNEIFINN